MKKLIAMIAASAALTMLPVITADIAAAKSKAKHAESSESAPAPSKATAPSEGAASGEQGVGSGTASQPSWDDTYNSDKAQEKQLKSGGR